MPHIQNKTVQILIQFATGILCWQFIYFACAFIAVVFSQLTVPSSAWWSLWSPLRVLCLDMSWLCGSWSVAHHIDKAPMWWTSSYADLHDADLVPFKSDPAVWHVKARLLDGWVRYKTTADHRSWQPVFFALCAEVNGGCFRPDWSIESKS